jgi:hypothetical protein
MLSFLDEILASLSEHWLTAEMPPTLRAAMNILPVPTATPARQP